MAAKKNQVQCSFCGGNSAESSAVKFFQGQDRKAVICADCVDICIESLAEDELAEGSQVSTISHEHTPRSIFDHLCKHVVGQDDAKRALSVAAFSHMERKRLHENPVAGRVLPQKSNVLMVGPTGSGKTLIASTLAKHLGVPFVSVDATRFTEAGYIGDDVQDVIPMLIGAASMSGGNPEWGIVFWDEADKLARKGDSSTVSRDVSGEGVQQAILKLIEGGPVRSTRRGGPMRPNDDLELDTSNVLFVFAGSFEGLGKIVARRCEGNAIGFGSAQKTQRVRESLKELSPKDLVTFGIIPELVGRLPVIAKLEELTEADFLRVLTEPVDSITRQYQTLFSARGVTLKFEDAGLLKVAHVAKERGVGSRGLRSILEAMLLETMFELPEIPKGTVVTLGADGVRRALPDSVAKVA